MCKIGNKIFAIFSFLAFGVAHLKNCAFESFVDMVREGISCEYVIAQPNVLWNFIRNKRILRWPDNSESLCNQHN